MSEKDEKLKALQLTIDKLEKTYGKGAVMKLSDERVIDVPAISTGSLGLDIALGVGGIPRGRVIEIYGPESSGKTTLSMHCIAEAQRSGGRAAGREAEQAGDKIYAEICNGRSRKCPHSSSTKNEMVREGKATGSNPSGRQYLFPNPEALVY